MSLKVLVVDDEFVNRKLLSVILKKYEHIEKVIEASDGRDALEQLEKNEDIDIILLDVFMPVMNGLEFLEEFKKIEKFSHVPVIVLSTDDTKKADVLKNGANVFLLKPIKENILFDEMEDLMD